MIEYLIVLHSIFVLISLILIHKHSKGQKISLDLFVLVVLAFVPIFNIVATINTITKD